MRRASLFVLLALLAAIPSFAASEPPAEGFVERTTRLPSGATARFEVWLPPGFTPEQYWPAVLFLHGRGESGTDNHQQIEVGLGPVLRERPRAWPFIAIFPQKPDADVLWSARQDLALAVLAEARAAYPIDVDRIYLTGLSQGGEGAWELAAANPRTFAAVVPICGWSAAPDATAHALGGTPVWLFHGMKDDVVPPGAAQKIAAALQREGHPPRITLYADANHNSWDRAYRTKDLPRWLLKQRRPPKGD